MPEPETYAEYLWRERTESGGEVDKTTSDISASSDSDTLPESECGHVKARLVITDRMVWIVNGFCPKCGEKL